jgi:hypothetical protein
MALTDYLEDKILQHVFMNVPYTPPTTVYVGLYTVAPTDIGTDGTEVTGGSYARQPVSFDLAPGGAGRINNDALLTFTSMPDCDVVAATLHDAVTGGNMLVFGDLPEPISYTAGDNATAAAGLLNFYLA